MFSGGLGYMYDNNNYKEQPKDGDLIVRIGGPAYKIGIGGGSASVVVIHLKIRRLIIVQFKEVTHVWKIKLHE